VCEGIPTGRVGGGAAAMAPPGVTTVPSGERSDVVKGPPLIRRNGRAVPQKNGGTITAGHSQRAPLQPAWIKAPEASKPHQPQASQQQLL
jgi:hypothetical protein